MRYIHWKGVVKNETNVSVKHRIDMNDMLICSALTIDWNGRTLQFYDVFILVGLYPTDVVAVTLLVAVN